MRLTHYDEHKKRWQINDDHGAVMIDELNYAIGEAIDKLGAYEDTGLTPETCKDIKSLCDDYVDAGLDASLILACIAAARAGISSKRMTEISKAETDNRLIILPCKVGDMLYEIDLPEYGVIVCKVLYVDCYCGSFAHAPGGKIVSATSVGVEVVEGHGKGSSYAFEKDDFGKTVFLTLSEADAALKGEKA